VRYLWEVLQIVKLSDLIHDISPVSVEGNVDIDISGIAKDSRMVQEGYMFFATSKSSFYMDNALKRGASVLVTDSKPEKPFPCTVIVTDVPRTIGRVASHFNGYPSKRMHIAGITGTNGKTTITYLIESMLRNAGKQAGVIGTISYRYNDNVLIAENTTPGAIEIHGLMKDMYTSKVKYVAMEVSSHALDQRRVESVEFDVGIFTNLTHDHLDYHGDFEHYKAAKKLLFEDYLKNSSKEKKYAILNIDDPVIQEFTLEAPVETLSYSTKGYADAHLIQCSEDIDGLKLDISLMGKKISVASPLIGMFNASNILASMLYGVTTNIPYEKIKEGIEKLGGVPGRLERVRNGRNLSIFIDYAHTPDALNNVLTLLKHLKKGQLIVVFGCGGDRDTAKRPVMGSIATNYADLAIITSDNPRSENPLRIIEDIKKGMNGKPYRVIENRKEAIFEAVNLAGENDVLLVAGKGHEDYQIIGTNKYHFSDREVIEEALNVAS
jgi:UDP-N-acetylmuramoyl-L-alanyl-D-glutamate--2,6-diaminopimelate ligase